MSHFHACRLEIPQPVKACMNPGPAGILALCEYGDQCNENYIICILLILRYRRVGTIGSRKFIFELRA